jgi:hypothetical protein
MTRRPAGQVEQADEFGDITTGNTPPSASNAEGHS